MADIDAGLGDEPDLHAEPRFGAARRARDEQAARDREMKEPSFKNRFLRTSRPLIRRGDPSPALENPSPLSKSLGLKGAMVRSRGLAETCLRR